MTTIAYKDGVLAADRRIDGWQSISKIFKLKNGAYVAGAGNFDDIIEAVAWLDGNPRKTDRPELPANENDILLIDGSGAYWLTDPFLKPVKILEPFYSVGSGSKYALGAMASGMTAIEAVGIAMKFDPNSGGGIDSVTITSLLPGKRKKSNP
jgi:20S proteasome alpha/beta subunit